MLKNTFRVIVALSVLAVPTLRVQADASFRCTRDQCLWHVWDSPAYRQAFPDWNPFWQQVSETNNIPFTDAAWRRIAPNREILLPPLPGTASADEVTELEGTITGLQEDLESLGGELEEANLAVGRGNEEISRLFDQVRTLIILLVLAGIAFGVSTYFAILYRRRWNEEQKKVSELSGDIKQMWVAWDNHFHEFEVPKTFGKVRANPGSNKVYLVKATRPVDGEDGVFLPWLPEPVKVKNIMSHLSKATDEELKELTIVRERQPVTA